MEGLDVVRGDETDGPGLEDKDGYQVPLGLSWVLVKLPLAEGSYPLEYERDDVRIPSVLVSDGSLEVPLGACVALVIRGGRVYPFEDEKPIVVTLPPVLV